MTKKEALAFSYGFMAAQTERALSELGQHRIDGEGKRALRHALELILRMKSAFHFLMTSIPGNATSEGIEDLGYLFGFAKREGWLEKKTVTQMYNFLVRMERTLKSALNRRLKAKDRKDILATTSFFEWLAERMLVKLSLHQCAA